MAAPARALLSQFGLDVLEGLSRPGQKAISPRYFYDDLGSALFEAITLLPEYGLTRADERLLQRYSRSLAQQIGRINTVAELGSGSGKKTRHVLESFARYTDLAYRPIDVSGAALQTCERELSALCDVKPVCADWLHGLQDVTRSRTDSTPLLLLFLGSSIGNLERRQIGEFLAGIRSHLRAGDYFLLGADLVKDIDRMLAAYDDPTGVTAAFNLNLLGRINRELDGNFDLRSFAHEVRWNQKERRIEMHLLSGCDQKVNIRALDSAFHFRAGETIWTESSHKFTVAELDDFAKAADFKPIGTWVDNEWPFAETLWQAC